MTVNVGMFIPREVTGASSPVLRGALAKMEREGLDHVCAVDHVSFHSGWGQDGLMEAMALAMLNESLPVYVGVYLLALRQPVTVARQLAQFALRAPGRLTLGIGVGGEDRREVAMCGVDPRTRGRRTDECMEVIRALMGGDRVSYRGRFFGIEDAKISPAPVPAVPLVVGGRDPRVLERAGRLGDGWLGIWSTPEKFAERLAAVHAAAAAAGRTDVEWEHGMQIWCGLGSTPERARQHVAPAMEDMYRTPFERFARYTPCGTPAEVAAYLKPYVSAGCGTFNLTAPTEHWEESVEGLAEVRRLLNG